MQAEIRRLHTPDVDDLANFEPADPENFALLVQVIAGPAGGPGEESFDLEVVTPKHLAARVARGPMSGRHLLIVRRFDAEEIRQWINQAVASCSGQTWQEVAGRLGRIGHWEFEDYSAP